MKKTLVIMAAGMGSRFGGIKQVAPVGPNNEIISDYNVYNAVDNGFKKLVFIIRKEHENIFREQIICKFKNKIEVDFAYQEFDTIKIDGLVPTDRRKMFGTAHALLCAKNIVNDPFVVINADDFYSKEAFKEASKFIDESNSDNEYLTVNFSIKNVINPTMPVKRGVCFSTNNVVNKIVESEIFFENGKYNAVDLTTNENYIVDESAGCSVNMLVLKPSVFDFLQVYFDDYTKNITLDNECFLPTCLTVNIESKNITLKECVSDSKWISITYKEDVENLKKDINNMIDLGIYPYKLWE